jgi:hypothetical protein
MVKICLELDLDHIWQLVVDLIAPHGDWLPHFY